MSTVNVMVAEKDASAFYRLTEPARVLAAAGHDVETHRLYKAEGEAREADTYIFNRPAREGQFQLIEWLVGVGKRVVIDMDDDLDNLSPQHSMFGFDTRWVHRSCQIADLVTVSTPALAKVYGYGHSQVIPNCIPERWMDARRKVAHDGLWVGWYGTVRSHPNDLAATDGGIFKGIRRSKAEFAYVGDPRERDLICSQIGLTHSEQIHHSPLVLLHLLPEAISNFDIGMVPLERSLFNESKSWLKGLELAAVGVPFVATPTAEYASLNARGAGVLAETRSDWSRALQELAGDAAYRAAVAVSGRLAAASLTFEANQQVWANAWLDAPQPDSRETISSYDAQGQAFDPLVGSAA